MARLPRKDQRIFGETGPQEQFGQVGSLAVDENNPETTKDITDIQSLTNYLEGWFSCVIDENAPSIEDMNSLFYLITRQLAYVLQRGIPEWSAGTEYHEGSFVQFGNGVLYKSIIDDNLNNQPTDVNSWEEFSTGDSTTIETQAFSGDGTLDQRFVLDEAAISKNTLFITVGKGRLISNNEYELLADSSGDLKIIQFRGTIPLGNNNIFVRNFIATSMSAPAPTPIPTPTVNEANGGNVGDVNIIDTRNSESDWDGVYYGLVESSFTGTRINLPSAQDRDGQYIYLEFDNLTRAQRVTEIFSDGGANDFSPDYPHSIKDTESEGEGLIYKFLSVNNFWEQVGRPLASGGGGANGGNIGVFAANADNTNRSLWDGNYFLNINDSDLRSGDDIAVPTARSRPGQSIFIKINLGRSQLARSHRPRVNIADGDRQNSSINLNQGLSIRTQISNTEQIYQFISRGDFWEQVGSDSLANAGVFRILTRSNGNGDLRSGLFPNYGGVHFTTAVTTQIWFPSDNYRAGSSLYIYSNFLTSSTNFADLNNFNPDQIVGVRFDGVKVYEFRYLGGNFWTQIGTAPQQPPANGSFEITQAAQNTEASWEGKSYAILPTVFSGLTQLVLPFHEGRDGQSIYFLFINPAGIENITEVSNRFNSRSTQSLEAFNPNLRVSQDLRARGSFLVEFVAEDGRWVQVGLPPITQEVQSALDGKANVGSGGGGTPKTATFVANPTSIQSNTWNNRFSLEIQSATQAQTIILPDPADRIGEDISVIVPVDYFPNSLSYRYYSGITLRSHINPLEPQMAFLLPSQNQKVFTFTALNATTWLQKGNFYDSTYAARISTAQSRIASNTDTIVTFGDGEDGLEPNWLIPESGGSIFRFRYKGTYTVDAKLRIRYDRQATEHRVRTRIMHNSRIVEEELTNLSPNSASFVPIETVKITDQIRVAANDTLQIDFLGLNNGTSRTYDIQTQANNARNLIIKRLKG